MWSETDSYRAILYACLLFTDGVSSARIQVATPRSLSQLRPRDPLEHVVLADCKDSKGVLSSQVAYFPGSPNQTPQDVAIVKTPDGQSRLWAGVTTSALFTTTGVTFTAELGPQVADGEFAGTGNNGFGDFTCWQEYVQNLYKYDGRTCSQVYDCNHDPKPSVKPTPSSSGTSSSPTASSSTTSSASPGASSPAGSNDPSSQASGNTQAQTGTSSGLSPTAQSGLIAGLIVAAAIALLAVGFIWYRRRAQRRDHLGGGKSSGGCFGLFGRRDGRSRAELHGLSSGMGEVKEKEKEKEMSSRGTYELDGHWRGNEMYAESRGELDGGEIPKYGKFQEQMGKRH